MSIVKQQKLGRWGILIENNTLEFEFFETKNAVPKIVAFFLQEPPYLNLKKEQKKKKKQTLNFKKK